MIINDLDDYYIVFDTKNRNTELDTLFNNPPLCQPHHRQTLVISRNRVSAIFHFSLFTLHFSLFTFHFSLFTFHFSLPPPKDNLRILYNKTKQTTNDEQDSLQDLSQRR